VEGYTRIGVFLLFFKKEIEKFLEFFVDLARILCLDYYSL
jgi:hypothetical protein